MPNRGQESGQSLDPGSRSGLPGTFSPDDDETVESEETLRQDAQAQAEPVSAEAEEEDEDEADDEDLDDEDDDEDADIDESDAAEGEEQN